MGRAYEDLSGLRFGRLVAIRRSPWAQKWRCECDCGAVTSAGTSGLNSGKIRSCGCLKSELMSLRFSTHRKAKTSEHVVWSSMRTRCNNPKSRVFKYYGARGIKCCERWGSFENFLADMGPRPSLGHTLDRIDNSRGYQPDNCRWATRVQQARNHSGCVLLTLDGATRPLPEWAEIVGIKPGILRRRIRDGWSVQRALSQPAPGRRFA